MRRPLLFLLLLLSGVAHAHEVRPAYFEIVERQEGSYSLTWKQPPLAEARVAIEAVRDALQAKKNRLEIALG